ncbi:MAG: DNA polymerase III subunit chi [Rickettsiales bacterium]
MRIDFYRLTGAPVYKAIPFLVEKAYESANKIFILVKSQEDANALDGALWSFRQAAFIPHDVAGEGDEDRQPVLIGTDAGDARGAPFFFIAGASPSLPSYACDRVFFMFDGEDASALQEAREFWKKCGNGMAEKHYWSRDEKGKWQETAL